MNKYKSIFYKISAIALVLITLTYNSQNNGMNKHTLVSATEDGVVEYWDTETKKRMRTRKISPFKDIAMTPRGKFISTVSESESSSKYDDLYDDEEFSKESLETDPWVVGMIGLMSISFAPKAHKTSVSLTDSGPIVVKAIDKYEPGLQIYESSITISDASSTTADETLEFDDAISSLASSPDGKMIAASFRKGYYNSNITILMKELDNWAPAITIRTIESQDKLTFFPEDSTMLASAEVKDIHIWKIDPEEKTYTLQQTLPHPDANHLRGISISQNGEHIAVLLSDAHGIKLKIAMWYKRERWIRVKTIDPALKPNRLFYDNTLALNFDGSIVAVVNYFEVPGVKGTMKIINLLDTATGKRIGILPSQDRSDKSIPFLQFIDEDPSEEISREDEAERIRYLSKLLSKKKKIKSKVKVHVATEEEEALRRAPADAEAMADRQDDREEVELDATRGLLSE